MCIRDRYEQSDDVGRNERPEWQCALSRKAHEALRDDRGETGAGHDAHDAAVERKLQQNRTDRARPGFKRAHVADRSPVKQQPQHQGDENKAVDVERETLAQDRMVFVEHPHQEQQYGDKP